MNKIRFTYEDKNQLFDGRQTQDQPNGITKLISKYERVRPDEEQESLIDRKNAIQPNSLNYSQIYSDLRISRNGKIQPTSQHVGNGQQSKKTANHSQTQINMNLIYIPKSLPKIRRNSKLFRQENPKYDIETQQKPTKNEQSNIIQRKKAMSISHYDIYAGNFKKSGVIIPSAESSHQQNRSLQNSSCIKSDLSQPLQEQNLIINFDETQKDLPEIRDHEPSNMSSVFIKEQVKLESQKSEHHPNWQEIKEQQQEEGKRKQINLIKQEIKIIRKQPKVEEQPAKEIDRKSQIDKQAQSRPQSKDLSFEIKQSRPSSNKPKSKKDSIHKQQALVQNTESLQLKKSEKSRLKSIIQSSRKKSFQMESKEEKQIQQFIPKQQNIYVKQQHRYIEQQRQTTHQQIQQRRQLQEDTVKLIKIQSSKNHKMDTQNQPKSKQKVDDTNRDYEYHKFNVEDYMNLYQILKSIHRILKSPLVDSHNLIKEIKKYLEIVAGGGLDHVEGYDMPLHRLKIVKNALLFERIAIVTLSFALAVGKVKETLKYMINLISYTTNNTLLILKILESSEISKQVQSNLNLVKSERIIIKRNYDTVRNNNDIILDSIFKISKYQQAFCQSFKDILKSVGKNSIEQTFYNVLEYFAFFLCVSDLYRNIPFLAVAPNPYLRETMDKRATLVIDIVEVFCHGTKKSKNHVFRPHTQHFLNQMAQYYQIVSFTCAYPNQIDKVIDILDPKKHIKHRLYRHHAIFRNTLLYKDTERIGRDLKRLILLDSESNVFSEEINNTIIIPAWRGNKNDTTLAELCPILAAIAIKHLDCKQATTKIHEQQIKNENAGIKYLNFDINLQ